MCSISLHSCAQLREFDNRHEWSGQCCTCRVLYFSELPRSFLETDESWVSGVLKKAGREERLDFVNYIYQSDTIEEHNAPYRPSGDGSAQ